MEEISMPPCPSRYYLFRWLIRLLTAALLLASCTPAQQTTESHSTPTSSLESGPFSDIPTEARVSNLSGEPRPPAYWMLWNACAPENRAEVAAANGGRDAGWVLMDDLLAKPGISLGDLLVRNCYQGLALLQGLTLDGEETDDTLYDLAAQLLAAELNLNLGAETCPIAEEAVVGGHMVLSSANFTGNGTYFTNVEVSAAVPRLLELLQVYNSGELCR